MIAIKDMEMPKRCAECRVCINQKTNDYGTHGKCLLQNESVDCLVWSRDTNCPLTEIITCKDCKHRDEYGCRHEHPNCKDNFYCRDGERRESK